MERPKKLAKVAALFSAVIAPCWLAGADSTPLPSAKNASEILGGLQRLNTLGSVLYVAAHPDDENTRLISYLSRRLHLDVAYLSLTRGDGGQNLIGPELREKLGIIRTQELLAARRIDGAKQFFTRAVDFGYSKTAEETLRFWDGDAVLSDMVWVIRQFRPDVIVTRFSPEPSGTHGHHTASAQLAIQAFEAAADPERFPDQLQFVDTWQARRIVWNGWRLPRGGSEIVSMDVGGYDALSGKAYAEIAAESRSMHKSQGFGSAPRYGRDTERFILLGGEPMRESLFDGTRTDWTRIDPSGALSERLENLIEGFEPTHPSASIPELLTFRRQLADIDGGHWAERKLRETDQLLAAMAGVRVQARSSESSVTPGEEYAVELFALNHSGAPVRLKRWRLSTERESRSTDRDLDEGNPLGDRTRSRVPEDAPISQPYWLRSRGTLGMFEVEDPRLIGQAENDSYLSAEFVLEIQGQEIAYETPVIWRTVSPVEGEQFEPTAVVPKVSVSIDREVVLFPNFEPREALVRVEARRYPGMGELRLELPEGWRSEPEAVAIDFREGAPSGSIAFEVIPPKFASTGEMGAVVTLENGERVDRGESFIAYRHFPEQSLFPKAEAKIATDSIERLGDRVGYLAGAGDSIPESLEAIGYRVDTLAAEEIELESMRDYDAVVLGIRAYNTIENIADTQETLWRYAKEGGVVIVQYNTTRGLKTDSFAPYPLNLSRDRVTDEAAPVSILDRTHPALSIPNQIGPADFEGWTQERGLYFPNRWSPEFTPLLSSHDPGERPLEGGLLVAEHGEGYIVYTGYSWFRQLPAGVPGAYRIFANLVSLGKSPRSVD